MPWKIQKPPTNERGKTLKTKELKEVTVCEDESEAYEYWNHHSDPNPYDCCNLHKTGVPPLGDSNRFRKTEAN